MKQREVLLKMREWIKSEQAKARLPHAEPFVLTSLCFCAEMAAGRDAAVEETLAFLRSVTKAERMPTYDVVTPNGALFIINRALATLC